MRGDVMEKKKMTYYQTFVCVCILCWIITFVGLLVSIGGLMVPHWQRYVTTGNLIRIVLTTLTYMPVYWYLICTTHHSAIVNLDGPIKKIKWIYILAVFVGVMATFLFGATGIYYYVTLMSR